MKIITHEHIFEQIAVPSCHASTILKLKDGTLLAAWFAGQREGATDVTIWFSRKVNGAWVAPEVAVPNIGIQCWNPVLFQRDEDTVWLFYKRGGCCSVWRTMLTVSKDSGKTWSEPTELTEDRSSIGRGPVKNKVLVTRSGNILAPASIEQGPWRCFIDHFDGEKWSMKAIPAPTEPENVAQADGEDNRKGIGMIQPTLWEHPKGHIHALMRTNRGLIYRSDSDDDGLTWSVARPTDMANNNSGIDCVRADDGNVYLLCNPVSKDWGERSPLTMFVSRDNGDSFEKLLDLETEKGEFSYPAVIAEGNRLYITYTWRRKRIAFAEIEV
ncbi:MAG: exo-alpha-sialidase [Clostridia bacterium]|nr:exo-alpha-sialidase [Clostridia bacterium]